MNSRYWLTTLRVCALIAVLASAALFIHYLAPAASGFCGPRSGCEAVRTSSLGSAGNQYFNLPVLGLVAFGGLFALSFLPSGRPQLRIAAAAGGFIAIALIMHQALAVGSFCWLCLVVDAAGVGVAYAAASLPPAQASQSEPLATWAWAVLLALAIASPVVWVSVKPSDALPAPIAALQSGDGLSVIEFADFQCPHCRRLHPLLKAELKSVDGKVAVQRFHVPLPFHNLAEGAARAAVCAARLGQEEAMTDLLFEEPLVDGVWLEHAARLGLDPAAFKTCLQDPTTTKTLSDHVDLFNAARLTGLPATFIGEVLLKGAPPAATIHEALSAALKPAPLRIPALPYGAGVFAAVALTLALGRKPKRPPPPPGRAR